MTLLTLLGTPLKAVRDGGYPGVLLGAVLQPAAEGGALPHALGRRHRLQAGKFLRSSFDLKNWTVRNQLHFRICVFRFVSEFAK